MFCGRWARDGAVPAELFAADELRAGRVDTTSSVQYDTTGRYDY